MYTTGRLAYPMILPALHNGRSDRSAFWSRRFVSQSLVGGGLLAYPSNSVVALVRHRLDPWWLSDPGAGLGSVFQVGGKCVSREPFKHGSCDIVEHGWRLPTENESRRVAMLWVGKSV
ncbi:hypothetical protein BP00DRAFT_29010 [Aspergillus indologenus CBS 114.80]|uniref:Uncharacterized protein n=1 Tax=Aspergillus indologenus CBS 114.80 TaxID=1450541 RepID=A0A2V5HS95_9EURO|nr:hypothetical protein BP00DRAFT_29010 [Aspergillus indologenus CBS 114.80]